MDWRDTYTQFCDSVYARLVEGEITYHRKTEQGLVSDALREAMQEVYDFFAYLHLATSRPDVSPDIRRRGVEACSYGYRAFAIVSDMLESDDKSLG